MSRSPTLTLVVAFVVVFALQRVVALLQIPLTFALAPPVGARPWTLVTSVYAHLSVGHLLANVAVLLLVGLYLERQTSRLRFHAFFLLTGALSGLAEVWASGLLGPGVAVLGASGGIAGLVGYVLAGNRMSDTLLDRTPLSPRAQLGVFVVVAGAVTVVTAGPGVALIAHFAGLLIGLAAGRLHLLRPSR
ncbi:rhomboid family intramembrane serine protease [Halosimplex carlsbadense]|uniref:rhomboid family intramembrane serine protease n=1 Tax=Halosimplex carlsbadense TaxID=171164 RepID=UPI0006781EC3|nr:rhomboid family intramembrane serine protease [Halosimplex carlsbadense]